MVQLHVESHGVCTIYDLNMEHAADEVNSKSIIEVRDSSLEHLCHVKCDGIGVCCEIHLEQLVCCSEVDDEIIGLQTLRDVIKRAAKVYLVCFGGLRGGSHVDAELKS